MNLRTFIFVFSALALLATLTSAQTTPYNKLDKLKVNDLIAGKFEVQSTTKGAIPCPSMTQTQRNAIPTPLEGSCVFNQDSNSLNVYDGSAWVEVGAGGAGGGINNWETAYFYDIGDVVIQSNKIYQCNTAHTSSVFATDIAKWTQLANNVSDSTGVLPMANGGTDKNLTPVLGGVVYTDDGSMEVLGAGTSGQYLKSNGGAAPSWTTLSIDDSSFSGLLSLSKGGTNKNLTAEDGAILYLDADSVEKLSPGTSGQVLQSNGAGAPSFANKSISAKSENGSSVTLEEVQVSNNQLTQTDTNKHLIESGNNNLLVNPSFEHSTFSTGWTNTNGTFAEESVIEIHGKKASKVTLTAQSLALYQDSTLYASQFADGVQGLASVRVKTSVSGIKVCAKQAGVTVTSLCVDVQANGKWGLYKVPFILGATSNGISINSNGTSVTGTVYVDDSFVGAVDLSANIDASKIAGESYFAGTASCNWPRSTTTLGVFTATAACPGPTIVSSTMGQWQTTDSDLPRQTINNLPAGNYKATFIVSTNTSAGGQPTLTINDGTTSCESILPHNGSAQNALSTISCSFSYNSTGNRSFELFGSSTTGSLNITNSLVSPRASTKFILEYFGSSSVYSSTNADTDWASCGHTAASFTGFGTPTAIETQCKRQGSDLLMKGKFTGGTPTAVEARLSLPVWNGSQLVSAGSSIIPSIQIAGFARQSSASAGYFIDTTLIETSVSYVTFGQATTGTNGVTKLTGNLILGAGNTMIINARIPIAGWQNSNIIIGQFNGLESCTSTLECTDTFSAAVSSAGVVSKENVNWLNGNCSVSGTSTYTCNFNSSIFAVAPNCVFISNSGANINLFQNIPTTASSVQARSQNNSNIDTAQGFDIICQKQGVDYVGKTAKAVASDQNLRSVGLTKAVVNSCLWTSAGAFNNTVMCNAGFSSMSKPATGRYQLNFARTQSNDPVCVANNTNVGADRMCNIFSISTTNVTVQCENSSVGTDIDVPGLVICHGVEQ